MLSPERRSRTDNGLQGFEDAEDGRGEQGRRAGALGTRIRFGCAVLCGHIGFTQTTNDRWLKVKHL